MKDDFSENVKEKISFVINVFKTTVMDNIQKIHKCLIDHSSCFIAKTRENFGERFASKLTNKNWHLIPSVHHLMDILTQEDAIQVMEENNKAVRTKLFLIDKRVDYLESKARFLDLLILTKIFSD